MSYFTKRPTQRVVLPSDSALWVEVYAKFTWKQEKLIGEAVSKGDPHADAIIKNIIADWNLTEENGEIAPVDSDHIDQLDRMDAIAIISAVNGLAVVDEDDEAKKASSNASPKR